jgi:elongation factor 2
VCLAKSQNKHNRLYAVAEPLSEEFCAALDNKEFSARDDKKELQKKLVEQFGWDSNDTKKLWCFGPDETGPNVLVDQTKGVQYMNEIQDSVTAAYQWATKEGAMTQETMRGIRINIVDANLISDSIHRGGGQIIPAGRRVIYAA